MPTKKEHLLKKYKVRKIIFFRIKKILSKEFFFHNTDDYKEFTGNKLAQNANLAKNKISKLNNVKQIGDRYFSVSEKSKHMNKTDEQITRHLRGKL